MGSCSRMLRRPWHCTGSLSMETTRYRADLRQVDTPFDGLERWMRFQELYGDKILGLEWMEAADKEEECAPCNCVSELIEAIKGERRHLKLLIGSHAETRDNLKEAIEFLKSHEAEIDERIFQ